MAATVGIVVFPGTNCEHDVAEAVAASGAESTMCWHGDTSLGSVDAVVIPGGFAHGDYLRPGAIARFSPIMAPIIEFANDGGPVLGICNGFQILTEVGLLPGALQKNAGLKFRCAATEIRIDSTNSIATGRASAGQILSIPVNHFEGNFTCSTETLAQLRDEDRIVLRYVDNPNGSIDDIAGVTNAGRNVVGMMPHPERACHRLLGSQDGLVLFGSMLDAVSAPA